MAERLLHRGEELPANGVFLLFKVDDSTRGDYERLGREPFRPFGEENAMGYYEVPADVLEDLTQLEPWMQKAIGVARKARQRKRA